MEHKSMLGNVKMLMERDGGYVAINPKFDKLITSLRTAVEKGDNVFLQHKIRHLLVIDNRNGIGSL